VVPDILLQLLLHGATGTVPPAHLIQSHRQKIQLALDEDEQRGAEGIEAYIGDTGDGQGQALIAIEEPVTGIGEHIELEVLGQQGLKSQLDSKLIEYLLVLVFRTEYAAMQAAIVFRVFRHLNLCPSAD